MARHHRELLVASRMLLRREGQRGRLSSARIRRSVSTSYYALFHFLLEDCTQRVTGRASGLLRRRRILARVISHRGAASALRKLAGLRFGADIVDFFRLGAEPADLLIPDFLRNLSKTFLTAQAQRHSADYDLNSRLTEFDATALLSSVEQVIEAWQAADGSRERDFKAALSLLMLVNGKLRGDGD